MDEMGLWRAHRVGFRQRRLVRVPALEFQVRCVPGRLTRFTIRFFVNGFGR